MAVSGLTTPPFLSTPPPAHHHLRQVYGRNVGTVLFLEVRTGLEESVRLWNNQLEGVLGGGTTDDTVGIFYDAIEKGKYECFVNE